MIPLFLLLIISYFGIISTENPVITYCFYSDYFNCEPNVFGSNSSFDINNSTQGILRPPSEPTTVKGYNFTCTSTEPIRWLLDFPDADVIHSKSDPPAPENNHFRTNFQLKLHHLPPSTSNGIVKCVKIDNESEFAQVFVTEILSYPVHGQFSGRWAAAHFYVNKKMFNNVVPCTSFGSPSIASQSPRLFQHPQNDKVLNGISDDCVNCICHPTCSNSSCTSRTCSPNFLLFGKEFWEEGGYHNASSEPGYQACLHDYECTSETIRRYLRRYKRDCNGDGIITCEDYIRIYRVGRRKCDSPGATRRLKYHEQCLQSVDVQEKELQVRTYDQRIGMISAKPLSDFTSIFVCSVGSRSQQITYWPLNPESQLKSEIYHDYIKMANQNQSSVICNVEGGVGMQMQLDIHACFKPTDCDLRYRPFYGFGEFTGNGDAVQVNTSIKPTVNQVIKELTVPQGLASCFGIQQQVPTNETTPFAVSFAYFFTDFNGTIHFFPGTSTHLLAATESTSNSIQLTSTTTELYNGAEEDFTCRIVTYFLSPKFQFGVSFEDGTVKWVPEDMTNTEIAVQNSEWDLSAVQFIDASIIATRTLRLTARSGMQGVICKAPVTLSWAWVNASLPIVVHLAPKGTIASVVIVPLIIMLILLGTLAFGLRERQQQKLRAKLRKLTEDEIRSFRQGDDTELVTFPNGMINVDRSGFLQNFILQKDDFECFDTEELGKGHYGRCFKGVYQGRPVAVKTTRSLLYVETFIQFLREAKLMAHIGRHPHIVEFIGAYVEEIENRICFVVMEFSPYGNLRDFLRPLDQSAATIGGNYQQLQDHEINFASFAYQIASGMAHLEYKQVIHGDLATRNVLVFENGKVKISDFGLSYELRDNAFVHNCQKGKAIPLAWMAPESIKHGNFSYKSDVWSYGVTLWEIYTFGKCPFSEFGKSSNQILDFLENGGRLQKPRLASLEIYDFMQSCWQIQPENRPSFRDAMQFFRPFVSRDDEEYLGC